MFPAPKPTELPPFGQAAHLLASDKYRLLLGPNGQAEAWLNGQFPISAPQVAGSLLSPGRRFYLRDLDSQAVWELTSGDHSSGRKIEPPVLRQMTLDSVVTTLQVEGLTSHLVVKLDADGRSEVWQLTLVNNSPNRRRLAVFAVFNPPVDDYQFGRSDFKAGVLTWSDRRRLRPTIFMTSQPAPESFDSDHQQFYDRFDWPTTLLEGKCNRTLTQGRPAVMVLAKSLALSAKSQFRWQVDYGYLANRSTTLPIKKATKRRPDRRLTDSPDTSQWSEKLRWPALKSPDPILDIALNQYWKYQAQVAEEILPATVVTAQAVALTTDLSVLAVLESLNKLLSQQSSDGLVVDATGAESPDGDAWLVWSLVNYWRETADWSLADRQVAYRSGGQASVISHFSRALASCLTAVCGNDGRLLSTATLEATARAYRALTAALPVLHHLGDNLAVERYQRIAAQLADQFESRYWTGRRYRTDASTDQSYAKQDMLSKWLTGHYIALEAIVAGLAPAVRARKLTAQLTIQALKMSESQNDLVRSLDIVGLIEANLLFGDPSGAWRLLSVYYPGYRLNWPAGVPYGFWPSTITAASHPLPGQMEYDRTDSAAGALYLTLTEKLIGVSAHFGGLNINPHLPKDWRRIEYSRRWRGSNYHFRFDNPLRIGQGIERIVVDGLRLTGQTIPPRGGGDHFVEVVLG
ncbi:MAG: hypothetical protein AAB499_02265 [Patescibacteria group bacterium]